MARKSGPVTQPRDVTVALHAIDERYRTLRTLIRSVALVGGFYVSFRGLAPLAGKETAVSLAVSLLADVKFIVSIALTGTAVAWAVVERKLRQRKTEYLQGRVKELEEREDPSRSTSGLTPAGKTNPEDRRS